MWGRMTAGQEDRGGGRRRGNLFSRSTIQKLSSDAQIRWHENFAPTNLHEFATEHSMQLAV